MTKKEAMKIKKTGWFGPSKPAEPLSYIDLPKIEWRDNSKLITGKNIIRGRGYLGVQKSVSNHLYDMQYLEDKLTTAELSGLVDMIHDHVKAAWQEGLNQGEELKPVKKDFRCSRCGIRWGGINILDNPIHTCTFCGGKIVEEDSFYEGR